MFKDFEYWKFKKLSGKLKSCRLESKKWNIWIYNIKFLKILIEKKIKSLKIWLEKKILQDF